MWVLSHSRKSPTKTDVIFLCTHVFFFFLLAANLNTIYRNNLRLSAPMWSSAATPLPAPPPPPPPTGAQHQQRLVTRLTGPVDAERSGAAADGHPPAGYGSGAAAAEVHPRGSCCSKRPFSSHCRSRRPWRSDFLRSSLTSCLGADCSWRRRGQRGVLLPVQGGSVWRASESGRLCGARDHSAAVRHSLVANVTHREKKASGSVSWLSHQKKTQRCLRPGMLPVCCCVPACVWVCMCVEAWTRLRCASPKLRRINAAFTDGREPCKGALNRMISMEGKKSSLLAVYWL